jgi:hypothetical protein
MADQTTEPVTNPTEAVIPTEAAATSLLTSTEPAVTQQQQSEPAKAPEGEAKPAAEGKTEEAKPEGAPGTYEFKAPEGQQYDPAILDSFAAAAKQANLTQDAAQKLLESMAPAVAERQKAQVEAVQNGWLEAARTDKEFGGDKLPENLAVAKTAFDRFASPELKTLLNTTGLGNHPEMIRLMVKVGKAIGEDSFVSGGNATSKTDVTALLYPKTPKA